MNHRLSGTGGDGAAAHDHHRPLSFSQCLSCLLQLLLAWNGPPDGKALVGGLDHDLHVAFGTLDEFAKQAQHVYVYGSRRGGRCLAESLGKDKRQLLQGVHLDVVLGQVVVQRIVHDLLVGIAVLKQRWLATGDRDHW